MAKLKLYATGRGFGRADFSDMYGSKCSIQKSSLGTEDAIWLGVDELSATRMHLNREQVKDLLPVLVRFVKTGEIFPRRR